jgi:hypothetical protein
MSDPFLPAHRRAPDRDGREIDIDHDEDVLFEDGDDGDAEVPPSSAAAPPFRTPVPGDRVTEGRLDDDLGVAGPLSSGGE